MAKSQHALLFENFQIETLRALCKTQVVSKDFLKEFSFHQILKVLLQSSLVSTSIAAGFVQKRNVKNLHRDVE